MSIQMAHGTPQRLLVGDLAIGTMEKAILGEQVVFRRDK
jgi:hypothetical protein